MSGHGAPAGKTVPLQDEGQAFARNLAVEGDEWHGTARLANSLYSENMYAKASGDNSVLNRSCSACPGREA